MFSEISHDNPTLVNFQNNFFITKNWPELELGNPFNTVLSPEQAEEWCEQPQIGEFPKKN